MDNEGQLPEFDRKIAAEVAIEEYKALRSEIVDRVKNESVLVTAIAVLAGAGATLASRPESSNPTLLIAVPLVLFSLALAHLSQSASIAVSAEYLHKNVRPRLIHLVGAQAGLPPLMDWENFRAKRLYKNAPTRFTRVVLDIASNPAIVPGMLVVVLIGILCLGRDFRSNIGFFDWLLYGLDWLFFAVLIFVKVSNCMRFNRITGESK